MIKLDEDIGGSGTPERPCRSRRKPAPRQLLCRIRQVRLPVGQGSMGVMFMKQSFSYRKEL